MMRLNEEASARHRKGHGMRSLTLAEVAEIAKRRAQEDKDNVSQVWQTVA